MQIGSMSFHSYAFNLSRIYWSDQVDQQQRLLDEQCLADRVALVESLPELKDLSLLVAASKGIEG